MSDYTSEYHGYLGIPGEGDGIRLFLDNETDNLTYNTTNENLTDFLDRIRYDVDNILAPSNDHITDYDNPHRVTAKQTGAVSLTENETIFGEKIFNGFVTINELSATKITGDGSGITNIPSSSIVDLNNMTDITVNSIKSTSSSDTVMNFTNGAITLSENSTFGTVDSPISSIYASNITGSASLDLSTLNNSVISDSVMTSATVSNANLYDSMMNNTSISSSTISDTVISNATFNSDLVISDGYKLVGDGSGLYNLDEALPENVLKGDGPVTIDGSLTLNNSSAYLSVTSSSPKLILEYPSKFKYSLDVSAENDGSYPLNVRPYVYDETSSSYVEESGLIITNKTFAPHDDLSHSLGEPLKRWKSIYSDEVISGTMFSTNLTTSSLTVTDDVTMNIPQSSVIGLSSYLNDLSVSIDTKATEVKNDVDVKLEETQASIEEFVNQKMDEIPERALGEDTRILIQQLINTMLADMFHGAYEGDSNFIFEGESDE